MRSNRLTPITMVQALTVLTVLKMMTKAQTTCGGYGRILYERLPNIQLQGYDDDIVRDTSTPFMVLEKCQDLCLRDRASNNIVRTCTSFDYLAGSRLSFNGGGGGNAGTNASPEYEESTCYLSAEQARPEGIGSLTLTPNSVHFTEVCLTSKRPDRECPNRLYVFERHPQKRLKLMSIDMKEVQAANRTECEDKCLDEFSFVCRSATYDSKRRTCILSRFTRRTHPELLEDEPESDYLENTCLSAERRCDGLAVFIKEENKRFGGPFQVDQFSNLTLEDCQAMCVRAEKYFCRSIEYDEMTKQCTLSEEDSVSQKDDLNAANNPTHHYYDFVCLDSPHGQEYPDNPATSHLFTGKKPDTAFQRYRNSRLGGEHHSEISGRSLSECLDECLRQPSFQCRSAEYSERYRTCRLTRYNQRDGMRIIYDADYDYYENLMLGNEDGRPGDNMPGIYPSDDDRYYNQRNRYRPNSGGGRYPPNMDWYSGGRPNWMDRFMPDYPRDDHRYSHQRPGGIMGRYPYPDYDGDYNRGPQGNRFSERDYYGSRGGSGGRYNDRYGGNRYGGQQRPPNRYGGGGGSNTNRYDGHRFQHHGADDGYRWYIQSDRRPGGRPIDAIAGGGYNLRPQRPISPGPDGPIYDNHIGGGGPGGIMLNNRPSNIRCEDTDQFNKMGTRQRMRREYVRRFMTVASLNHCQRECADSRDFTCRSFNYRDGQSPVGAATTRHDGMDRDNCELSDRDSRELELNNSRFFDKTSNYDYYEKSISRMGGGFDPDCLDVSQICSDDGMEFTLRTPDGFYGRIYTYGYYDRCFFRGNGGTLNVLRISGAQGYPDCGTVRTGDTMMNIVVVQFSDNVQTSRDKRFNLTCLFRGPGEAIVSSGFIGAGSGSPTPVQYLPAENTLSSKVRLMILYQGRPTTTIAVGDPLTFRLEAQDGTYTNYPADIFASNVVARDPYSGRSVQLIDRFGCPVDSFVFPELDRGRSGDSLEARFNAFKIPESNFLVFEATVKTCRDGCQPAYCQAMGNGRSEPSFGRRKRSVNDTNDANLTSTPKTVEIPADTEMTVSFVVNGGSQQKSANTDESEYVREMIEVFDTREELQQETQKPPERIGYPLVQSTVCLTSHEYSGLVTTILCLVIILLLMALIGGLAYRRYWYTMNNKVMFSVDRPQSNLSTVTSFLNLNCNSAASGGTTNSNLSMFPKPTVFNSLSKSSMSTVSRLTRPTPSTMEEFEDPSEPIYTDASLFDKPRSLRSINVTQPPHFSPI